MGGVAVVTGGAGGLGKLIVQELGNYHAFDDIRVWDLPNVDVGYYSEVQRAAHNLERCDVLVNCAGLNRLRPWLGMSDAFMMEHMQTNAFAHLYTAQALWPFLVQSGGTVCNIISNASHKPMTHSLAYNASKAAAAMVTRQMAREAGGSVTIFGVSPNRLRGTPMSESVDSQVSVLREWSAEETQRKQREAMPIGEETDPAMVAEFIGFLLSTKARHRYLHGSILEYGL